jgi:hypothetical protein
MEARVNSDSVNCTEEEIFSQVLGVSRSRHVRGKGCGVRPTRSNSSRARSTRQIDIHEECKKHRQEIEASHQRMCEEMAPSQERVREEIWAEMRPEIQAKMERVLSQFRGLESFSNHKNFHTHTYLICNC